MAVDLSVEFCGIKFKNPFLLASTPATRPERWKDIAGAGWAGGMTWGNSFAINNLTARFHLPTELPRIKKGPSLWSCQHSIACREVSRDEQRKESIFSPEEIGYIVREAKKSGLPVGANLIFSTDPDLWVQGAKAAERGGADMLELNLSCPYRGHPPLGVYLSKDISKAVEIVKAVRGSSDLPIIAKLHAWRLPTELKHLAEDVVKAGADAISTTNMFDGLAGVDIETGVPVDTAMDTDGIVRAHIMGFSGPAIKPLGLMAVAEISSAVNVPIIGIGGIANWHSAVEYMMLGAGLVQVGMAAMLFGYNLVHDMIKGLQEFMQRKGYEKPSDFIGIAHKKVSIAGVYGMVFRTMDVPFRKVVNEELCNGCGLCMGGCLASANGAIQVRDGIAQIEEAMCTRCNVCEIVCPTGAIRTEWSGHS
jgi:dihydropyrimidine dehydrogenase (NAD+) subunit PreA